MVRFSLNEIAEAAETLDFPTTGHFAVYIWEHCSNTFSPEYAAQVYRAAGYIPFSGYPLARSGKIERMSREEVEKALLTNPVIEYLRDKYGDERLAA